MTLIGDFFGRLRVVRDEGRGFWKCRCDCGQEVWRSSDQLRHGLAKDCGRHRPVHREPNGEVTREMLDERAWLKSHQLGEKA